MVRVGSFVLFLVLEEKLSVSAIEYNASCGVFICGLYSVDEHALSAHFVESCSQEWILLFFQVLSPDPVSFEIIIWFLSSCGQDDTWYWLIKASLVPQDKSKLIVVNVGLFFFLMYCGVWSANNLFWIFISIFIGEIAPLFAFKKSFLIIFIWLYILVILTP